MRNGASRRRRRLGRRPGRRVLSRRGLTLLEVLLAIVIMTIAGLAIVAMLQKATIASFKARQSSTCARMAQTGMARLKNVDFYDLFAADSASPDYGLQAGYPYMAVLDGIRSTLAASKFDRFRVDVTFMRRDTTDALGTGNTNNLIPFKDNGSGADVYDPNIRYYDANGDGDYYDTYVSNGRTVAEQPDTHMKLVTVDVFRNGVEACSTTQLISLEQFTGATNPDSEAALTLEVSTPTNSSYAYQLLTPAQIASRALPISGSYPSAIVQYRADSSSPLTLAGVTAPLAAVSFYVGGSGALANASADVFGAFSDAPAAVTAALVEGQNEVRAQSAKATYSSPIADRSVLLDVNPPAVTPLQSSGTTSACAPYVAALLTDPVTSTSAAASGIYPGVTAMLINGSTVPISYDAPTGIVVWVDTGTQSSPKLADGSYAVAVEAGDYAGYKSSATWSFAVSVPSVDNSAPSIANKSPIGMAGSDLPVLSVRVFDNQSGIDPSSIVLTLDGATVVDASDLGPHYDPASGTVSYTPSAPFASGSYHTLSVTASHCAASPSGSVTSTDSWGFTAP
ncbi:MAG: prepilin-type N-terminal cleavage/methylation domain-containing protein [Elusimicrobia bacterium]|nr:prepilin-type N-terminal cleavage/methylation domain-containing protein [Elusimicrobiota bacterium]